MNRTLAITAIALVAVIMGMSTVAPVVPYVDASHGPPAEAPPADPGPPCTIPPCGEVGL